MGIKGLLQALKSIQKRKHISEYKGEKVAVDSYCWLHKAIYSCMDDLYVDINSDQYINFFLTRIKQFHSYGITPILIFDGANLPMKNQTEDQREKKRHYSLSKFEEYKKLGMIDKAKKHLVKSIDITPLMVFKLIKVLRKLNIEYYVAPYEADAQLAYLSKNKYVNLVITEDSDLLVYNCERVLFQLDSNGYGFEISLKDLKFCKELNFTTFTKDMFIQTCILSGCDYIDSISGIGLKTGHSLISKYKDYKEVIRNLTINPKYIVPKNYEECFEKAYLTFKLQLVFCPIKKSVVHLENILNYRSKIEKFDDYSFFGKFLKKEIMDKIISGDIDPNTLEPFQDEKEISNIMFLDDTKLINSNQTTLNKFFPNMIQLKRKLKKTTKTDKKMITDNKYTRRKRKFSEFCEYPKSIKKRKKFKNENIVNNFKEDIINPIETEKKKDTVDLVSSDFEEDTITNQYSWLKTNEKSPYNCFSDFETGSFNFDDYKYKDQETKKSKKKIKTFNQKIEEKINLLEKNSCQLKLTKISNKNKKNVEINPLLPKVVINIETDEIDNFLVNRPTNLTNLIHNKIKKLNMIVELPKDVLGKNDIDTNLESYYYKG